MHAPRLQTQRLELVPFTPDHTGELWTLFREPTVRKYLLDDILVSRGWVEAEITSSDARFREGSAGLWTLCSKGNPRVLGFAGFREFFDPPELQLLYGLQPDGEGRGLATEGARAVCDYGFDVLGFTEIRAATDVPNVRSVQVLERLGFTQVRTSSDGDEGTLFFAVSRSDWTAR